VGGSGRFHSIDHGAGRLRTNGSRNIDNHYPNVTCNTNTDSDSDSDSDTNPDRNYDNGTPVGETVTVKLTKEDGSVIEKTLEKPKYGERSHMPSRSRRRRRSIHSTATLLIRKAGSTTGDSDFG